MKYYSDELSIQKRGLWREWIFCFTIITFVAVITVLYRLIYEIYTYKSFGKTTLLLFLIFLIIHLAVVAKNIAVTRKKNHLLVHGTVIWADVERVSVSFDWITLTCSKTENEKVWIFRTVHFEHYVSCGNSDLVGRVKKYPVIVNPDNWGEYIVLLRDVLYHYKTGFDKPVLFTKVIRKIHIEESDMFYTVTENLGTPGEWAEDNKLRAGMLICITAILALGFLIYSLYIFGYLEFYIELLRK